MRALRIIGYVLIGVGCCDAACAAGVTRITGSTMGTTYAVSLPAVLGELDLAALRVEIETLLETIDERMSTYRDDSEVSRFNAAPTTRWFTVSADTRDVVDEAQRVGLASGGALDVTAAPLIALWGFGGAGGKPPSRFSEPTQRAIAEVAERVGLSMLSTREDGPALRKSRADLHVDLSAIAKGFAVDRICTQLESHGIEAYLVEIGGEVRAHGHSPAGGPWRVAIERPSGEPLRAQTVLELTDGAIATSGDYRRYFWHDGRRYSHIIDPRKGRPVEHQLASVTVVDQTAMRADAYATALLVLGPEVGLRLAREHGLAALFVVREGDGFRQAGTPQLERYRIGRR
jgi:thiamine biosynthesis lipoprotein